MPMLAATLIFRAWPTCGPGKGSPDLITEKGAKYSDCCGAVAQRKSSWIFVCLGYYQRWNIAENMLFYAFNLTPHHLLLSDQKSKILKTTKFIQLEY